MSLLLLFQTSSAPTTRPKLKATTFVEPTYTETFIEQPTLQAIFVISSPGEA